MDSVSLSALAASIAFTVCKTYPKNELLLIGSFFSQIGETITRVSLQNDMLNSIHKGTSQELAAEDVLLDITNPLL